MKMKFMFHSIENTEFLFRKEESVDIFDGSKVVTEISLSKDYSKQVIEDVAKTIHVCIDVKYCGSLERVSREVFILNE